jgi:predicted aldo/keto reductase-like oxidoreductase
MDAIDVIQFHGGMYEAYDVEHILNEGLLDALQALRERGLVRFVGFTVEEPWTARPLIASGRFDVVQMRYNLIYQSAALHALDEAIAAGMGVAVMRPMTSGILPRIARYLAPQWSEVDIYRICLRFVLSDSRVHVANVGMRWPAEVAANVEMVESFRPTFDMAELPRMTATIYKTEDQMQSGLALLTPGQPMTDALKIRPRTLMGPGPSDVHPRLLAALAQPTVGHLDPQFLGVLNDVRQMFRPCSRPATN